MTSDVAASASDGGMSDLLGLSTESSTHRARREACKKERYAAEPVIGGSAEATNAPAEDAESEISGSHESNHSFCRRSDNDELGQYGNPPWIYSDYGQSGSDQGSDGGDGGHDGSDHDNDQDSLPSGLGSEHESTEPERSEDENPAETPENKDPDDQSQDGGSPHNDNESDSGEEEGDNNLIIPPVPSPVPAPGSAAALVPLPAPPGWRVGRYYSSACHQHQKYKKSHKDRKDCAACEPRWDLKDS